jgi:hypothetical protein
LGGSAPGFASPVLFSAGSSQPPRKFVARKTIESYLNAPRGPAAEPHSLP